MRCFSGFLTTLALWTITSVTSAAPARHPITIDDVLAMEHVESASFSPDAEWVAVVARRAAGPGEVYGRTAFETDPGRSDIWLVSSKTGQRRQITDGKAVAAGYWCAAWSPDGRRLAMLSTQPEGSEPPGGDNVRLYVWDRDSGRMRRQGTGAMMTQTHYGSPMTVPDMRGGADRGTLPHACSEEENAPFLWLDNHRLLAATLPVGQFSGLIDQFGRAPRIAARDAALVREGRVPTGVAFGSGGATVPSDPGNHAVLRIIDVASGAERDVAKVPVFPFLGTMSVAVSPDGHRLAVLATTAALPPAEGRRRPFAYEDMWAVQRKLGFIDLRGRGKWDWASLPPDARYPLELYHWSPDSKQVVLRARSDPFADRTQLYLVPTSGKDWRRIGSSPVAMDSVRIRRAEDSPVVWIDADRLLVRMRDDKSGSAWWLIGRHGEKRVMHGTGPVPDGLRRNVRGALIAIQQGQLVTLDPVRAAFAPVARLADDAQLVWPRDPAVPTTKLLVNQRDGDDGGLRIVDAVSGAGTTLPRRFGGEARDVSFANANVLMEEQAHDGLALRGIDLATGQRRDLMMLNQHLRSVDWGEARLVEYHDADGAPLKAGVLLPPGYDPTKRYPTLVWVYQGYEVRSLESDYFLDPYLPGLYNLRLYAAHGYVVAVPSMPLPPSPARDEPYALAIKPILPAIDHLIKLGIADPDRLGVFGQSRGGYTVAAILTQTDRFKAGVALAGVYDLASDYRTFDPAGYGWPGIGHQKSINWAIYEQFGRFTPPSKDFAGFTRNSPLSYIDKLTTPLLIVHGEADVRGNPHQAEQLFGALYEQGKTAQYVRYAGESHSLAQSPANVRDIVTRAISWFDRFLTNVPTATSGLIGK